MNKKDNQNHLKETEDENLLTLKRAIYNYSINKILEFNGEWGESYVIITPSPDNHALSRVSFYQGYLNWESGMCNPKDAFNMMRFFLSEQISDEEIHYIL